jgi:hypothetical protein
MRELGKYYGDNLTTHDENYRDRYWDQSRATYEQYYMPGR